MVRVVQKFVLKQVARTKTIIHLRTKWGTVSRLDCDILILRNPRFVSTKPRVPKFSEQ